MIHSLATYSLITHTLVASLPGLFPNAAPVSGGGPALGVLSPSLEVQLPPQLPPQLALGSTDKALLTEALSLARWQQANEMTSNLLLRSVQKLGQGFLIAKDTERLPCSDLRTIDNLWTRASEGRYGLSTQAKIWRSLKGKTYEDSLKFEAKVGWNGAVNFGSEFDSPAGHLPLRPAGNQGVANAWGGWWIEAMTRRLETCTIIAPPPKPTAKPGETKPGETKPGETKPREAKPGQTKPGSGSGGGWLNWPR